MTKKPAPTLTTGPLHLEDLEPHRFEDLVRRLIYDFRSWRQLEAIGPGGQCLARCGCAGDALMSALSLHSAALSSRCGDTPFVLALWHTPCVLTALPRP